MDSVVFVTVRHASYAEAYGGDRSTIATAVGLRALGIRPTFVTTADDGLARELEAAGIDYVVVPVGDPFTNFRGSGLRDQLRRIAAILRVNAAVWARARRGAVVHTISTPGFFCGLLGGGFARAPVILHVRGASTGRKVRRLEEVAMFLAARTIAVSGSLRDQLLATGGRLVPRLLGRRVLAIHNGFDFAEIDAAIAGETQAAARAAVGPAEDRISLLHVGAICPDKGQLAFIERVFPAALAQVPGLHVTFVGGARANPDYHAACLAAVRRLGLDDHVTFTGYRDKPGVYRHYRAADVLVLPSEREGLPRCVVEAHAFALPVVATAIVGTVEAARDGETGFLVPVDRLEDMVAPIVRLARDPSLRARMGAAGAAHVRGAFSLERNVGAIAAVYREVAR